MSLCERKVNHCQLTILTSCVVRDLDIYIYKENSLRKLNN